MVQRIIYPIGSGIAVVVFHDMNGVPFTSLSAEEIARKDVPAGVPYLIVDEADIPTDRTYRDAWTADFSSPHGYGIGPDAWFAEQAAMAAAQEDGQ